MRRSILYVALGALVFAGCEKQDLKNPAGANLNEETTIMSCSPDGSMNTDAEFTNNNSNAKLSFKTIVELLQVRAATEKYRDFRKADRDGYKTINVVMQNMGYHFMKQSLKDSVFNHRKPEILVYNKKPNGRFELVAVEYAVPLDQSVNAPEGFTGNSDVWTRSEDFGLWLLHAWVWKYNPLGVFNPTNPNVIVL